MAEDGFFTDAVKVPALLCAHRPFDKLRERLRLVQGAGGFGMTKLLSWGTDGNDTMLLLSIPFC